MEAQPCRTDGSISPRLFTMEEMRNETAHEKAVEIAERMLKSGKLSYEEIAEFAELTIEEVKALNEKGIA